MGFDEYNVLGLVPARGGSKGVPNKNITDIDGDPLISYVINALQESDAVDRIVCTTDSEEIASVARECGAEVPFMRPDHMAEDDSVIFNALAHAAEKTGEILDFHPDYVVTAQPTHPLMAADQVDRAVTKVITEDADSTVTVVKLDHGYHPYNIREQLDDGTVKFWKEEEHYKYPNRQEKPDFYHFGNLYVTRYELLVEEKRLEGEDNYPVEVDFVSSLDIDTPDDIPLIEYYMDRRWGDCDD